MTAIPNTSVRSSTRTNIDLPAVVAGAVLWGTGGLAGELLAGHSNLSPLAVGAWRLAVGGPTVLLFLLCVGRGSELRMGLEAGRRVLVLALLAALYQACYFAAVALTTVSLATLVTLGSAPVLVVVGHAALERRRPTIQMIGCVGVALGGLTLLVGSPAASGNVAAGLLLALVSAAGFATTTLLGARPVSGLKALPMVGLAFSIGGVFLAVLAAAAGSLAFGPNAVSGGIVVYLGVVPTALAYVLFFTGLRTVQPGRASLISLLEPLTAAVLGVLLLGDELGVPGVLGASLIAASVALGRRT